MESIPELLASREAGLCNPLAFKRQTHFTSSHVGRLRVQSVLEGHNGCVNRMSWNSEGTALLSGSDDRQLILWPYPDVSGAAAPIAVETQHRANIFGAQFLPCSNNARLVSGAMDHTVQLHELPPADVASAWRASRPRAGGAAAGAGRRHMGPHGNRPMASAPPRTTVYHCHSSRVKDVEVEPNNPWNFWSAGEDGCVRQFDTRVPTSQQNAPSSPNVLLRLRSHVGAVCEVKGLDICQARPHLLALACGDPFIRLYDRRQLSPTTLASAKADTGGGGRPLMMLAPAHLAMAAAAGPNAAASRRAHHTTYVSFSNSGTRLVGTYHGDQAYAFDVTGSGMLDAVYPSLQPSNAPPSSRNPLRVQAARRRRQAEEEEEAKEAAVCSAPDVGPAVSTSGLSASPLPPKAEEAKVAGNRALFDNQWPAAVEHFTRALHFAPGSSLLWLKRAEALLARGWPGDALWALADCDSALQIEAAMAARNSATSSGYRRPAAAAASNAVSGSNLSGAGEAGNSGTAAAAAGAAAAATATQALAPQQGTLPNTQPGWNLVEEGVGGSHVSSLLTSLPHCYDVFQPAAQQGALQEQQQGDGQIDAVMESASQQGGTETFKPGAEGTIHLVAAAPAGPLTPSVAENASGAAPMGGSQDVSMGTQDISEGPGGLQGASSASMADILSESPPAGNPSLNLGTSARNGILHPGSGATGGGGGSTSSAWGMGCGRPMTSRSRPASSWSPVEARVRIQRAKALKALGQLKTAQAVLDELVAESASLEAAIVSQVVALSEELGLAELERQRNEEASRTRRARRRQAQRKARQRAAAAREDRQGAGGDGVMSDEEALSDASGTGSSSDEEGAHPEDHEPLYWHYASQSHFSHHATSHSGPSPSAEINGDRGPGSSSTSPSKRPRNGHGGKRSSGSTGSSRDEGYTRSGTSSPSSTTPGRSYLPPEMVPVLDVLPGGRRLVARYVGHCNVQTDIKEVCYLGEGDSLVAAGSDDGHVFIYDSVTGVPLRALAADDDVANCIQCHPHEAVLATSGIESTIKLWSPEAPRELPGKQGQAVLLDQQREADRLRAHMAEYIARNNSRLREGPQVLRTSALHALAENPHLLQLLMSQLYGGPGGRQSGPGTGAAGEAAEEAGDDDEEEDADEQADVSCRVN